MTEYDVLLFGVTGFTGKLALEYILEKEYDFRFGVCARNLERAESAVETVSRCIAERRKQAYKGKHPVKIEIADLVCNTEAAEQTLRAVVKKARVCITTAGPFERFGTTLLRLCAEEGVHYAGAPDRPIAWPPDRSLD